MLGVGGLVEALVKRVSRVFKEYNLLRYCISIMAYWGLLCVWSALRNLHVPGRKLNNKASSTDPSRGYGLPRLPVHI